MQMHWRVSVPTPALMAPAGMGEFNGGGVFTLDNATFVGTGTFVADMGVITMSAAAPAVLCCLHSLQTGARARVLHELYLSTSTCVAAAIAVPHWLARWRAKQRSACLVGSTNMREYCVNGV